MSLPGFPRNESPGLGSGQRSRASRTKSARFATASTPEFWSRDRSDPLKFTKGVYGVVYEVIEVSNSWLLRRVERSLLRAMAREKKTPIKQSP